MPESGILLDYKGPVNLPIIDLLLKKFKTSSEFAALNRTTGKRAYALLVECLENILYYSELKSSDDQRMQPRISVRRKDDKIIIKAGNPVSKDAKDKLILIIEKLNKSNEAELKTAFENKINSDVRESENGAGLGFICMSLKSGNKISYSFNPLIDDYLYFEIRISINKYTMRKLIIDQTPSSPLVILDPDKNIYQITGESRPPDVREFYDQILSWLDEFDFYIINSENKKNAITFNFNFEYFNSSSGKLILDICKVLARLRLKGINLTVNWHFEKEDVDMMEVGKEMSKIVKFPFEFIETGVN